MHTLLLIVIIVMKIDSILLDDLTGQAKVNPRRRQNYDLRNSAEDNSQRMLNALEPDTILPVHRHRNTSEVVAVLRGAIQNCIFDDDGKLLECYEVRAGSSVPAFSIPPGVWHKAVSLESGTVILECKDGRYEPLSEEDILPIG